MMFTVARNGNFVIAEQLEHLRDECGFQERHVAGRGIGSVGAAGELSQAGRQPFQRAAVFVQIARDRHRRGQGGQRLVGRGDDHDVQRIDDLAHQADDALQHLLGTEGKRRFVATHAAGFAAAKDDCAFDHLAICLEVLNNGRF